MHTHAHGRPLQQAKSGSSRRCRACSSRGVDALLLPVRHVTQPLANEVVELGRITHAALKGALLAMPRELRFQDLHSSRPGWEGGGGVVWRGLAWFDGRLALCSGAPDATPSASQARKRNPRGARRATHPKNGVVEVGAEDLEQEVHQHAGHKVEVRVNVHKNITPCPGGGSKGGEGVS